MCSLSMQLEARIWKQLTVKTLSVAHVTLTRGQKRTGILDSLRGEIRGVGDLDGELFNGEVFRRGETATQRDQSGVLQVPRSTLQS